MSGSYVEWGGYPDGDIRSEDAVLGNVSRHAGICTWHNMCLYDRLVDKSSILRPGQGSSGVVGTIYLYDCLVDKSSILRGLLCGP